MSELNPSTTNHIVTEQQIWDALRTVPDPELPAISVVDMGIVRHIEIDNEHTALRITITPTFAGCPALSQIQTTIRECLLNFASTVDVVVTMEQPWTSDMLSVEAQEKLRGVGIAPPPKLGRGPLLPMLMQQKLTCPYCGSQQTSLENAFGPTPCRAIAYCANCHQPFEQFKPI
ncbi:phenylacetate-CoA oxygenase subunit PaaJ [Dictyobacter alpinus]|uniref:Phenylacetate-CoA oxygenase subunit PaaJ n=1 Tax=Dictyobacter alpinus TaxID=2014873 RepID=A0A402B9J4_9CHLR|nr:1,2-phenylacetyl-CoA epoxidase subunit PaaD [Dictyobacter alpinus]GCE28038.1 phenylacetate-CoA oxygenase subunit PaaJ [Dictyobacter alpinus]